MKDTRRVRLCRLRPVFGKTLEYARPGSLEIPQVVIPVWSLQKPGMDQPDRCRVGWVWAEGDGDPGVGFSKGQSRGAFQVNVSISPGTYDRILHFSEPRCPSGSSIVIISSKAPPILNSMLASGTGHQACRASFDVQACQTCSGGAATVVSAISERISAPPQQ